MHLRFVSHLDSSCFYFADKVNVAEEGRTSVSNRILKTCNVEVCCIVLPVLLARSSVNIKKKKKCCRGNDKN